MREIPFLTLKLGRLNKRTEKASLLALLKTFDHELAKEIISQFGEQQLSEAIISWPIIQEKGVNVNLAIDMVTKKATKAPPFSGKCGKVGKIRESSKDRKTV